MADPLTPTPEQIAAMEARGWAWDGRSFVANCGTQGPASKMRPLWVRVRPSSDLGWIATYGAAGYDWGDMDNHADPLLAADEAEAWLRSVLAGFRFPWLQVTP